MKRASWIRLLVLVLTISALVSTPAWAKTKKASSQTNADAVKKKDNGNTKADKGKNKGKDDDSIFDKKHDDDGGGVEINPDLRDFYAEVAEVTQLDEEGQKKLLLVQEKKEKALDKYDKKNEKMIVRIENELDRTENEKRRDKLRFELKKIEVNREKLQAQADNMALRVLNKDQLVAWNAYELWSVVSPELEFGGDQELTDEQVEKSKAICSQIAAKMGSKSRIAKNPSAQKMTIGQIGRQVLDKKQREAYARQQRRKRAREEGESKTIIIESRRGHHH